MLPLRLFSKQLSVIKEGPPQDEDDDDDDDDEDMKKKGVGFSCHNNSFDELL